MSVVHYPALSYITDYDIYLFNQGSHFTLYEKMGAHPMSFNGKTGVHFAVWAPNADSVSVIGDFNGWDEESHPLAPVESSGVWAGFIPGVGPGEVYKYRLHSQFGDYRAEKADPFGVLQRDSSQERFYRLGTSITNGAMKTGWSAGARATAAKLRFPFMNFISAHGVRRRMKRIDHLPTGNWLPCSPSTCSTWASPTSSSCR